MPEYMVRNLASVVIFTFFGCVPDSGYQDLELSSLKKLPKDWYNVPEQGTDSRVGRFESKTSTLVIHYDIGHLAGEYASIDAYPQFRWFRKGKLAGNSFRYLLNDDNTLYVTFSDEGPANFWAKISNDDEMNFILELLARYRNELLS